MGQTPRIQHPSESASKHSTAINMHEKWEYIKMLRHGDMTLYNGGTTCIAIVLEVEDLTLAFSEHENDVMVTI